MPAIAGRTHAPSLAGQGHDNPLAAARAESACESKAEDAALEVTAEFFLDKRPALAARRGRDKRASSRGSRRRSCAVASSRGGDARSAENSSGRNSGGGGAAWETRRRKRSWANRGWDTGSDRPHTTLPPRPMRAARVPRRRSGSLDFPVMASRRPRKPATPSRRRDRRAEAGRIAIVVARATIGRRAARSLWSGNPQHPADVRDYGDRL